MLVRHGRTRETRAAVFPAATGASAVATGVPVDGPALDEAVELGGHLPRVDRCWTSHARRTAATAAALGWEPAEPVAELSGWELGTWTGRSLADVHEHDPAGLARWRADPHATPHGGEGFDALRTRMGRVLERAAQAGGTTGLVVDGDLVVAAVLEGLSLPTTAMWSIDVAPCSVTELRLSTSGGGWRLRLLGWRPRPG
jgi:broad specificity phosphatase PhoE